MSSSLSPRYFGRLVRSLIVLAASAILSISGPDRLHAANTWNVGSGNWDTTTNNWLFPTLWSNGSDAIFGGLSQWEVTSGSNANLNISINEAAIAASSLTFNYSGINVAATGGNNLTLLGAGSITVNEIAQGPETAWGSASSYYNTISSPIVGSVGLTKLGGGTLNLSGANTYSGPTTISAGTLRLSNATALPGGISNAGGLSALIMNGGVLELANGNFLRNLGTGIDQFQITGGTSGFSSVGGARTVTVNNNPAQVVQWGTADFNPSTLVLNAFTANSQLTFSNPIDLNTAVSAPRTITSNSVGTSAFATLSGIISDTGAGAGLTKTGTGVVELSAANTYGGTTTVSGGVLRLSNANALPGGIGAAGGTSGLTLSGGVVELSNGDFLRDVGTGAAQFQVTGGISGFSARGAIRNVTVNNAAAQVVTWGSATFNPSVLLLNDVTADNQLNFNNKLDVNGGNRTIAVNSLSSFVNIAGEVHDTVGGSMGGLTKIGPGILRISTAPSYTGLTNVKGGTLEFGAANIFPDTAPIRLGVNDGENSSLGGQPFASTRGGSTSGNGASPGAGWARIDMRTFSDTVGTVTVDGMSSFLIGNGGTLTSTGSFEIKSGQILAALAGAGINLNKTTGGIALLDPQTGSSGANTPMSNTYTGTTTISGGVLRIFNLNAIPGGIATAGGLSALTINGGVLEMGYDRTNAVVNFSRDLGAGSSQVQITGGRSGFSAWNGTRAVNFGGAGATVTWGSAFFNPSILVLNESSAGRGNSEGASPTLTLINALDLNTSGAARTIDVSANHSSTFAGVISGNITDSGVGSGLTKTGVGVLVLSGAGNNYPGVTTVKSGGGIEIQNNAALGAGGAGNDTVVESGAVLRISNNLGAVAEAITLNGTGIVNNSFQMLGNTTGVPTGMYQPTTLGGNGGNTGALRNTGGANTINGLVTLASASRIQSEGGTTLTLTGGVTGANQDLSVGGAGDISITTVTTGSGKLTQFGQTAGSTSSTLNLTGASTYTGATTVRKGTINVATTGSINGATGTALDFTGNGFFKVTDASQNMGALTFSNGDGTVQSSRSAGTIAQTFSSYTAPIAGRTGSFVTSGTGVIGTDNKIVLTGVATGFMGTRVFANSAVGVTSGDSYAWYDTGSFVRAYTATDTDAATAAAGVDTIVSNPTSNVFVTGAITGQNSATINTLNLAANALTLTAANTLQTNGILTAGGSISTGNLQPVAAGGEIMFRVNTGTTTVSSVIQDNTNPSALTKSGTGTLTISTAPTYTGKTTVTSGVLSFTAATLGTLPTTEIVVDSGDLTLPAADYYVGNNVFAGGTSNNKITIQNGGRLNEGQKFYIGYGVNADFNTITVDGIGSQLNNTGGSSFFSLGLNGDHNKIVVSNGAYYGANGGNAGSRHYVGDNMGADYNTIEVKGAGSLFETSGNNWLTIGAMGSNNGATINTGGMMWTGALSIGGSAVGVVGGSNNTVTIADAGSILLTRKSLSIGRGVDAASNGITVSNGGTLYVQGQNNINEAQHAFELGASTGANNNFITVTGAGSKMMADYGWDANGNQGNVTNTQVGLQTGVIGYATTASGNHVDVLDGGLLAVNVRLEIGGVNSALNIGNGSGATPTGTFRDIALNTSTAKVKFNSGIFQFTKDTGAVTGIGSVQLDGPATVTTVYNNSIESLITGGTSGTFTKEGTGTLTLTYATSPTAGSTYTGHTIVKTGVLKLQPTIATNTSNIPTSAKIIVGDIPANSAAQLDVQTVNVANDGFHVTSGQTLAGHGTVLGRATIDIGGAIAPGNSVGTLTIGGSLTLSGNSNFEITGNASANTYDKVAITGANALSYGGTLNVSILTTTPTAAGIYTLFSGFSSQSGTFTTVNLPSVPGFQWHNYSGSLVDYANGQIQLELAGGGNTSVLSAASGSVSLGRMMFNNGVTQAVAISRTSGTDTTGFSASATGGATASGSGVPGSIPPNGSVTVGVVNTTGAQSGTVDVQNSGDSGFGGSSGGAGQGNAQSPISISVTGTVLANRTFQTGSTLGNLGLVHQGGTYGGPATVAVTTLAGTAGDDDHATRVKLVTGTANGLTITANATIFNSSSQSDSLAASGTFTTAGVYTNAPITLTTTTTGSGETATIGVASQNVNVTYSANVTDGNASWTSDTSGNWGDNSRWVDTFSINAAPGLFAGFGNTDFATFDGTGTTPTPSLTQTVTLNGVNPSVKSISLTNFSGNNVAYTIAPAASETLTLSSNAGNASITANSTAAQTITAPITISSSTDITNAGAGNLLLSGAITNAGGGNTVTLTRTSTGTLTTGAISNSGTLAIAAGSAVTTGNISSSTGATTVGDDGVLTVGTTGVASRIVQNSLAINGTVGSPNGLVKISAGPASPVGGPSNTRSNNQTSRLSTLTIANSAGTTYPTASPTNVYYGTLDLTNNSLVIPYGVNPGDDVAAYNAIEDMVRSGYNAGDWLGKGITSSTAATIDPLLYGVNVYDNAIAGLTGYTSLGTNTIVAKFGYNGDTNGDGSITADDYTVVDLALASSPLFYMSLMNGDTNHDGQVTADDYTFIDINILNDVANPGLNGGVNAVPLPEPSSFVLGALGLIGLLVARRRMTRKTVV